MYDPRLLQKLGAFGPLQRNMFQQPQQLNSQPQQIPLQPGFSGMNPPGAGQDGWVNPTSAPQTATVRQGYLQNPFQMFQNRGIQDFLQRFRQGGQNRSWMR